MTHVLLMLCGHVQDKDLHMSHSWKELYLNFFYFFPYECMHVPPGMHLGLHRRSRFPWRLRVVCKENLVSHLGPCARLGPALMVVFGSSDCQDKHISFTPPPNLVLCLWLKWRVFLAGGGLWLWGGWPIQEFGLALAFMNFFKCYRSISHSGQRSSLWKVMRDHYNRCLRRTLIAYHFNHEFTVWRGCACFIGARRAFKRL